MNKKNFAQELFKYIQKAVDGKIYGSIEIYFEEGNITQITQRIINKVTASSKQKAKAKKDLKQVSPDRIKVKENQETRILNTPS